MVPASTIRSKSTQDGKLLSKRERMGSNRGTHLQQLSPSSTRSVCAGELRRDRRLAHKGHEVPVDSVGDL